MEVKEAEMLDNLMDRFMGAIIKYDDPAQKLNSIEERLVSFVSNKLQKKHTAIMRRDSQTFTGCI